MGFDAQEIEIERIHVSSRLLVVSNDRNPAKQHVVKTRIGKILIPVAHLSLKGSLKTVLQCRRGDIQVGFLVLALAYRSGTPRFLHDLEGNGPAVRVHIGLPASHFVRVNIPVLSRGRGIEQVAKPKEGVGIGRARVNVRSHLIPDGLVDVLKFGENQIHQLRFPRVLNLIVQIDGVGSVVTGPSEPGRIEDIFLALRNLRSRAVRSLVRSAVFQKDLNLLAAIHGFARLNEVVFVLPARHEHVQEDIIVKINVHRRLYKVVLGNCFQLSK